MSNADFFNQPCQAFRTDVRVIHQTVKGENFAVVKDDEKGSYFRLTLDQFEVAQCFDGKTSLDEVAKKVSTWEDFDFTLKDIHEFHESLRDMNLLEKNLAERNIMLIEKRREQRKQKLLTMKGSAVFMRIPVVDPNDFFDRIIDKIRFLWSKTFVLSAVTFMLVACGFLLANWDKFTRGMETVYSFKAAAPVTLLIMYLTVLVIICFHELGHGLTCKNFGGECHELGFLFLFFQPCMFANVNDAWLFPNRLHRLYVTVAGVFVEFIIGSVCIFIWLLTEKGSFINLFSYQTMVICGLSTTMFNFNPLMKLDGYYALCDILELPNLKQNASEYLAYWVKTRLFRVEREDKWEYISTKSKTVFLIYGPLSVVYITMMLSGLFFMLKGLFSGALGFIGICLWMTLGYVLLKFFTRKSVSFLKDYFSKNQTLVASGKKAIHLSLALSALAFLFAALFLSVNHSIKASGTVFYAEKEVLYPKISAVIQSVNQTKEGRFQIVFDKGPLERKYKKLKLSTKEIQQRYYSARQKGNLSLEARLKGQLENLKKQEKLLQEDLRQSRLISTISGSSSEGQLDTWVGKAVIKGTALFTVYNSKKLHAIANVDERSVNEIRKGQSVKFLASGSKTNSIYQGRVVDIYPTSIAAPGTKIYKVVTLLDNNDGYLRQGIPGQMKITVKKIKLWKAVGIKLSRMINIRQWIQFKSSLGG